MQRTVKGTSDLFHTYQLSNFQ